MEEDQKFNVNLSYKGDSLGYIRPCLKKKKIALFSGYSLQVETSLMKPVIVFPKYILLYYAYCDLYHILFLTIPQKCDLTNI